MRGSGIGVLSVLVVAAWAYGQPPLTATAPASQPASQPATAPVDKAAIIKAVAPSLVKVELTLQMDKGESPAGYGWGFSGISQESIQQERPAEAGGFLVEPNKVVVADPMVHPRFVKAIAVRFGEQVVSARAVGYARDQSGMVLELAEPLKQAKPLAFDAAAKGPYHVVNYRREEGFWTITVEAMAASVSSSENGRSYSTMPVDCLIATDTGKPVALCLTDQVPLDDSWKGPPLKWAMDNQEDSQKLLDAVQAKADQCVLRVKVNFRSPKKGARGGSARSDEGSVTELNTLGVLTEKQQIMVLANLKPRTTARLEGVLVYGPKGEPVPAKFAATLTDYGAFLARLETPLEGPAELSAADIRPLQYRMLPAVQVYLRGEQRHCYVGHRRIASFEVGWKQHLYPRLPNDDNSTFVFDEQGRLIALPISRREKVAAERSYYDQDTLTAVGYVREVFADLAKNVDASNVPLTEEQENRLAWLGVELQPLNRELARVNGVSDQTQDGQTGALISYVYPGSPADKAGVKPGQVLLRLYTPDVPKPIEVTVEEYTFAERPFPWDRLDQVPERLYDQIPTPWPQAESVFTRTLTDLGFGKKFTAEFFIDGKSVKQDFEVVQSPPHYDTAPRCKSTPMGLTVRDLTYEVRRYFQKTGDDPGVIVSKIEPGGKASVAGIKPYEIITHVNDKPVRNVQDFEKLVAAQEDELRLSVLRMTKGRIVKIKPGAPASQPASTQPVNEIDQAGE